MALLATVSEESEEPSENWAGFPKKKFYITSVNKSKYTFDLKINIIDFTTVILKL